MDKVLTFIGCSKSKQIEKLKKINKFKNSKKYIVHKIQSQKYIVIGNIFQEVTSWIENQTFICGDIYLLSSKQSPTARPLPHWQTSIFKLELVQWGFEHFGLYVFVTLSVSIRLLVNSDEES